jgi:hypothetical protein
VNESAETEELLLERIELFEAVHLNDNYTRSRKMSNSDIASGDGSGNSAGDHDTEGNRDSRSPQEKRGSAQEHYSKGEVQNGLFEGEVNPVAEEIWNEMNGARSPMGGWAANEE